MLVRRLLALLVAVGLVFAAVQVRARVFGDVGADVGDLRIVCITELEAACTALATDARISAVEVADAGTTVERLASAAPDVDVWVTVAPWPQLAADARAFADAAVPPLSSTPGSRVLGRSPVVMVAHDDRAAALEPVCEDLQLDWPCLAEHAGEPWADLDGDPSWGTVDVGLPDPATRVDGLLALTQATGAFFGGAELTSRALDGPEFSAWLSELARAVEVEPPPLGQMLLTGPAEYEFAGALEAEAVQRRGAPRAAELDVGRLQPPVTAEVVAVGYGGMDGATVDAVGDLVADALAGAGWWVDGQQAPQGAAGAAPDGGVPSATVLEALRQRWIEVRGG